ncbi:putative NADH:ubiquinone reductase (H(+)-translocating) [Helianthus anomalus]
MFPLFFRISRMGWHILTSFMRSRTTKPSLQIKMSPTQLSRQEKLDLFIFFCGFGQEGQKRDAFYQSKEDTPCSYGPLTEE